MAQPSLDQLALPYSPLALQRPDALPLASALSAQLPSPAALYLSPFAFPPFAESFAAASQTFAYAERFSQLSTKRSFSQKSKFMLVFGGWCYRDFAAAFASLVSLSLTALAASASARLFVASCSFSATVAFAVSMSA